jgi:hypothetical protein
MIPGELSLDLEQIEPQSPRRPISVYDSILDSFIFSESNTVEVQVKGKDPVYVRSQLVRRIKARYLGDIIEAEVVNRNLYLSK